MQINVAQQLKAPVGLVRDYELGRFMDVIGDGNSSLVQGRVRLVRTDRGILVKGTLYTGVEVSCSRCLSLFSFPLVLDIEEEYFPTTDTVTGAPVALSGEPGCFTIDGHHILDLTEAVRQYALLRVPMKPLCREDCAGLCPRCGHDLNRGPCGCPPQDADSRWAVLSKLALTGLPNKGKETE